MAPRAEVFPVRAWATSWGFHWSITLLALLWLLVVATQG
jgi:hypothetical protein